MMFTHDFAADLAQIDLFDKQNRFALGRFADGEQAILQMRQINTADGWTAPTYDTQFRGWLEESLRCDVPGWHIGISCPCCDLEAHRWYMKHAGAPAERQTFSNIFANGNYDNVLRRIKEEEWLTRCAIVTNPDCCKSRPDYLCSPDVVNDTWGISKIVELLQQEGRPILLACGPAGAVIAHRYWTTAEKPTTIVDIGSILDPILRGRISRGYHDPLNQNRTQSCRWSIAEGLH